MIVDTQVSEDVLSALIQTVEENHRQEYREYRRAYLTMTPTYFNEAGRRASDGSTWFEGWACRVLEIPEGHAALILTYGGPFAITWNGMSWEFEELRRV